MDNLENQRNIRLIKEREKYEKDQKDKFNKEIEEFENSFLGEVVENMLNSEEFDKLMIERLEALNERYDFDQFQDNGEFDEIFYQRFEALFEMDEEDYIDSIDYPEGPNENLSGVYYDEPYQYDEPIDYEPTNELISQEEYYVYLVDSLMSEYEAVNNEDRHIQDLIKKHLEEENDYLNSIVEDAIQEGHYVPRAIDEAILDYADIDIEDMSYDYDDTQTYWYDKPDESIKEPFDSFDEIDYPEGNEDDMYQQMIDMDYDLDEDYEKYRKNHPKEIFENLEYEEIPEPPEVIAFTYSERKKLKSLLKDYYAKDDTLDKIVKEKLKEKKFNK